MKAHTCGRPLNVMRDRSEGVDYHSCPTHGSVMLDEVCELDELQRRMLRELDTVMSAVRCNDYARARDKLIRLAYDASTEVK